ncbi:MAG: polysaccharide deacetylase family protein [Eubacteriales bacterium]|nr:polysaccharide deacetylase family protein [Eubacteriales bacterium]
MGKRWQNVILIPAMAVMVGTGMAGQALATPVIVAGEGLRQENAGPGVQESVENEQQGAEQTAVEQSATVEQSASEQATAEQPAAEHPAQRHLTPDETSNHYAGTHAEPIFRVKTDKPWVALSFDAGADRGQAGAIMDVLEKYDLRSTFFLTADWMNQNPEDAKSIVARGHEIGNHSVNHPSFPKISRAQMDAQLQQTHQVAKKLTGVDMCLFRFPYGDYSNEAVDAVKANGYYGIQWSVDSIDWRNEGRDIMVNRVLNHKNLGNGSIVLMHIAATYTSSALEEIIQGIQAKGYQIVPVSWIIYENHYHMDYAGNQISDEQ